MSGGGARLSTASDEGEAERIRRTYRSYQDSPEVRRRWDPDNAGNQAIRAERRRVVRDVLDRGGYLPLSGRRVLDLGCGSGAVLASLVELGACPGDLCGVDLSSSEIEGARLRHPDVQWRCGNAEQLDLPSGAFSVVLAFTMFSSVLDDAMARRLAAETARLLDRDGAVLWYDFRYDIPYNRNVRGQSVARIQELFPGWSLDLRTITVLPPLVRKLRRATALAYPLLAALPVLRTHLIGLIRRPPTIPDDARPPHER